MNLTLSHAHNPHDQSTSLIRKAAEEAEEIRRAAAEGGASELQMLKTQLSALQASPYPHFKPNPLPLQAASDAAASQAAAAAAANAAAKAAQEHNLSRALTLTLTTLMLLVGASRKRCEDCETSYGRARESVGPADARGPIQIFTLIPTLTLTLISVTPTQHSSEAAKAEEAWEEKVADWQKQVASLEELNNKVIPTPHPVALRVTCIIDQVVRKEMASHKRITCLEEPPSPHLRPHAHPNSTQGATSPRQRIPHQRHGTARHRRE